MRKWMDIWEGWVWFLDVLSIGIFIGPGLIGVAWIVEGWSPVLCRILILVGFGFMGPIGFGSGIAHNYFYIKRLEWIEGIGEQRWE